MTVHFLDISEQYGLKSKLFILQNIPMTERVHVMDYDIDTYVNVLYNVFT